MVQQIDASPLSMQENINGKEICLCGTGKISFQCALTLQQTERATSRKKKDFSLSSVLLLMTVWIDTGLSDTELSGKMKVVL